MIRKYQESDRQALVGLWNTVFPDDPPHNKPQAVIDAKLAVDDMIFVAEADGSLSGACIAGYDGHRGWLYAVAVLPAHRRTGTGSALVKHALSELKKIGCIKTNLQIREGNEEVLRFYETLGFSLEHRISMGMKI